jgi:outer membrane lipoprotein-sorting protein
MMRHLKTGFLLLLAAFSLPTASAPAAPTPAAPTLAEVAASLAATETMVARFRQVAGNGATATGIMSLKRPGKVRFDYGPGAKILVVADGSRLSFIDYGVRQVSQWPLGRTPLGVLLDPAADLSRIARVLPAEDSPIPGVTAVLAQDPKRPDLGQILFLLAPDAAAPGGLRLLGWRVVDAQNNRTIVDLSEQRWNVAVPESTFRFVDPRPRPARPGAPG